MIDFMTISRRSKHGVIEIYPKFIIKRSSDLMIRGGDFYAIWVEERGLWSTDEQDAIQLIDRELDLYVKENASSYPDGVHVLHLWDAESGMIDAWHKYCQKQMRDNYHALDETLVFSNAEPKKKDYASKRLPYPLEEGACESYDKMMSVLYSPEERRKIEWAIGSVVSGDSKKIQKFCVLYGSGGTGKSTVLDIIKKLFEGYYATFEAKAIGSQNNAFAMESFRTNPLVALDDDADLSRIEDNTKLNSLIAHEEMIVNEKFKSTYAARFRSFLFIATNKPVKITDAKSGLIRRLIDITPTGELIKKREYFNLKKQIDFELGAIAKHCLDVYLEDPDYYDDYVPFAMMGASNDFYNFVEDALPVFEKDDGTTLKAAWEMYRVYCDEAKVPFPMSRMRFKEELKNYFDEYFDRDTLDDGARIRSKYKGFKMSKFFKTDPIKIKKAQANSTKSWLSFDCTESLLDKLFENCPAQYGVGRGEKPEKPWDEVATTVKDLDTSRLHYILPPDLCHIFVDFDIPDENGKKCFEKNFEAASQFPPTYAELSKSGQGIHLHYIYAGDPNELQSVFAPHIEVKVCAGKSSIRRKLSKCNDIPVATISSGFPLKRKEIKMVNQESITNEKSLRRLIKRNLNKEIHPSTKSSIDFISHILDEAYTSGMHYDLTDMRNSILAFAAGSTNQANKCIKIVDKMKFKSEEASVTESMDAEDELVFFDTEVFPNLFLVNWKFRGKGKPITRLINPSPEQIEDLLRHRLIGFNCRRYDNHMLYARLLGYTNERLYKLSQDIIVHKKRDAFFGEAYNLSYTDIHDFCSKKQSLKKWEIELGIHHKELGLPWDQPVPESKWEEVSAYCDNDVLATEAVFEARQADWTARQILAEITGMTVNDTTNSLAARFIFGKERNPQSEFNYRNMAADDGTADNFVFDGNVLYHDIGNPEWTKFDSKGRPIFPGYKYENGVSSYREVKEIGEGGRVYSEPGMYWNVALLDIESMHPSSAVAEQLFGKYTQRFKDILDARLAIKHHDYDKARSMLGGVLAKYLTDEASADSLSQALKIVINSVYGLTSASFDNPFRDLRNKDNIVAKRGALFMINLQHEVADRGYTVAHIKTDSIKIPNADPEIIRFVQDYGRMYGYNFEHEATYERMCLVNDAVYIARYETAEECERMYGYVPKDCKKHPGEWTATGTQFQVPYVFKSLFSHEDIIFDDLCETKSVTSALYLDFNEDLPDVMKDEDEYAKLLKKDPDAAALLEDKIAEGHNYVFIGRVGQFCPVKPGTGGGWLMRETEDKKTGRKGFAFTTGSSGYRWKESETVKELGLEDQIDINYYNRLADAAVESIKQFGDYEAFVSVDGQNDGILPWTAPDDPWYENTPFDVR